MLGRSIVLAGLLIIASPAATQGQTAVSDLPAAARERLARGDPTDDVLNMLGLFGLLGLIGLKRGHDEDGYHPAPLD